MLWGKGQVGVVEVATTSKKLDRVVKEIPEK